jgi:signal transduction histidine kinase
MLMLFAALLITAEAVYVYRIGRAALEKATSDRLAGTALEKQAALGAWVEDGSMDVLTLAKDPNLISHVGNHIQGEETAALLIEHNALLDYLKGWTGLDKLFLSILILDPDTGRVLSATDTSEEGKFREDRPFFIHGRMDVYVQDVYYDVSSGTPMMTISAPIRSADGRLLGVLAGHMNLGRMNEIITRSSTLHLTQDSFLVNTSHLIVTLPRFLPDATLLQRGVYTDAVNRCLGRATGVVAKDDYRGVPALIAYRWLPERKLCLIVKIDQAEAYQPVRSFGFTLLLIAVLGLLAASAVALILARSITQPVYQLIRGAREIGNGNLDYRIQLIARDELGQLARAFNQMTADLQNITASRDELTNEINDRKMAKAALLESEARYRGLFENMTEGYAYCKMIFANGEAIDWIYLAVNEAFETLTGLRGVIGKPVSEVIPGIRDSDLELFNIYARVALTGHPEKFEIYVDALKMWFSVSAYCPAREHFVAVFDVITQRKQAEQLQRDDSTRLEKEVDERTSELRQAQEKLVRQERLAVLGQLAGSVAHELRNPLGVMLNAVYYLKMILRDPHPVTQEYLELLESEVRISERIVSDLLNFSRIKTATKEIVGITELTRSVLEKQPGPPDVLVSTDIATDMTHVFVDPQQIEQVLDNLVLNAFQAMPNGGKLEIHAACEASQAVITIADTGCGIPKENMSKIFEPLFTTKAYGIGLGLPLSKELVEINGGRITADSEPGKGATFTLYLPLYEENK